MEVPVLGLSTYTVMHMSNSATHGVAEILKRAAIAFERIFFFPQGLAFGDRDIEKWLLLSPFAPSAAERHFLLDSSSFWNDLLLLPADVGDEETVYRTLDNADDPLSLRPAAHNYVLEKVSDDYFSAPITTKPGFKERGSLIGELVHDAYFTARLRGILGSGAAGLVTPLQVKFQQLAADHGLVRLARLEEMSSRSWVDIGDLSWKEILSLRSSPYITDFRKMLSHWVTEGSDDVSDADEFLRQELLRFAETTRPKLRDVLVATAANFLPPLSWAESARGAKGLLDTEVDHGWLLFLLELRRKSLKS